MTAHNLRVMLVVAFILSVPAIMGITSPWIFALTGLMVLASVQARVMEIRRIRRQRNDETDAAIRAAFGELRKTEFRPPPTVDEFLAEHADKENDAS